MACRRDQEKSPWFSRVFVHSAGPNTTIPMTVYNGFHDTAAVPARSMSVLRRRRDKPQSSNIPGFRPSSGSPDGGGKKIA